MMNERKVGSSGRVVSTPPVSKPPWIVLAHREVMDDKDFPV